MGADIPIANAQQHGWKMISLHDTYEKQVSGDVDDDFCLCYLLCCVWVKCFRVRSELQANHS